MIGDENKSGVIKTQFTHPTLGWSHEMLDIDAESTANSEKNDKNKINIRAVKKGGGESFIGDWLVFPRRHESLFWATLD